MSKIATDSSEMYIRIVYYAEVVNYQQRRAATLEIHRYE